MVDTVEEEEEDMVEADMATLDTVVMHTVVEVDVVEAHEMDEDVVMRHNMEQSQHHNMEQSQHHNMEQSHLPAVRLCHTMEVIPRAGGRRFRIQ